MATVGLVMALVVGLIDLMPAPETPPIKEGSFLAWAIEINEQQTAKAPLPDYEGDSIVVEEPCECGAGCKCEPCSRADRCKCNPCGCADCPQGVTLPDPTGPPLLIVVAATYECPHGERALREIIPAIEAELPNRRAWVKGKDYKVLHSDYGPCPQFYWKGKPFSEKGYFGLDHWFRSLKVAMEVPVAPPKPTVVMRSDYHMHSCSCGNTWSHHDSNAGNAAAHRCPACGRTVYRISSQSGPVTYGVYSRPVQQYYYPAQQGIFKRVFGGGCPSGNCP